MNREQYNEFMRSIKINNSLLENTYTKMLSKNERTIKKINFKTIIAIASCFALIFTVLYGGGYINVPSNSERNSMNIIANSFSFTAYANEGISKKGISLTTGQDSTDAIGGIIVTPIEGKKELQLNYINLISASFNGNNIKSVEISINNGTMRKVDDISIPQNKQYSGPNDWRIELFKQYEKNSDDTKAFVLDVNNTTENNINIIWLSNPVTVDTSKIEKTKGREKIFPEFTAGMNLLTIDITATAHFYDGTTDIKTQTLDLVSEGYLEIDELNN